MTTSSRQLVPASQQTVPPKDTSGQALGFSVNLDSGRGLLTTKQRRIGPLVVDTLSLEIPHLAFPFDVSGGAARFRNRRCSLVYLAMHVDAADLTTCFSEHGLRSNGFTRLEANVQDGYVLLAGHFSHNDHGADFTCRIAPVVQAGREVHLVFYDTRVYGFLPLPGANLTRYLQRAWRWPAWFAETPSVWKMRPIDAFAREMLPRGGWKIPTIDQLQELSVAAHDGQLHAACGEAEQPAPGGPEIPRDALIATDGIALSAAAETALHEGQLEQAYQLWRRAVDDGQGGAWAALRLLHLGAALPQFAADTRRYAQQFLQAGVHVPQARLTLAALAQQCGNAATAAAHFAALARAAQDTHQPHDAAAAWLAQSRVQLEIDVHEARQAGNAAVGLMPQNAAGHAHMYRLHRQSGDREQAARSAERWAQLCDKSPESVQMFCEVGAFFRTEVEDFARARRMYEHALARTPDDPAALEGLAELHLQRGDTSQAVAFYARLATHWEQVDDRRRAVACHMRLAELWQHRLGDTASACARYKRVVELDPKCLRALTTLADLAHQAGQSEESLTHYQAIIAFDTAGRDAVPDGAVHAYEQAIKIIQEIGQGSEHDALALAYLDRLVQLRPDHSAAAAMRLGFLRAQKLYDRLAHALEDQARKAENPTTACNLFLEAACVARDEMHDMALARRLMEAACAKRPGDPSALEALLPLLHELGDWPALSRVLAAATEVTACPQTRLRLGVALAHAQAEAGQPTAERVATLRRALEISPGDKPAAQALVDTLRVDPSARAEDKADAYETLARACTDTAEQARAWMAAATHHHSGLNATAAARRALALLPESASAHLLLINVLDAGNETRAVQEAFAAAAGSIGGDDDMASLWTRQAAWARKTNDTPLQLQALQGLANMDRILPEQAVTLATLLQGTGQTDRAVAWLEQWADAGAPLHPGEALLRAAGMLQTATEHARAREVLERVLRHAPPHGFRAAQALEDLAQTSRQDAWLVQAWQAQIVSAPDDQVRAEKLSRLLTWQADRQDPDRLDTARALLKARPGHALACHILAQHHDAEKAWNAGLDVRLAMLAAPAQPADAERRRTAYDQAAALAADLRPRLLPKLEAGFVAEFPQTAWTCQPMSERLRDQERWGDLLALRREQHQAEPENLQWQRSIATLLQDHFERAEEARNMWRSICAAEPTDIPSLQHWLQCAERAGDTSTQASVHASLARIGTDSEQAWFHALAGARLMAQERGDPQSAKALLKECLTRLAKPDDPGPLIEGLTALACHAEILTLAPEHWLTTRNTPAWTERIEHALRGQGRRFEHMAFVLHQVPLGTYDGPRALKLLRELLLDCPAPKMLPQQTIMAQARAFCAHSLRSQDPEAALEYCRPALAHHPAPHTLQQTYESLLLVTHRCAEAVDFRLSLARKAGLGPEARQHFEVMAQLCEEHLHDPERARWALEQAVHHAPRDADLLRKLLAKIPAARDRIAFVATAEALRAISVEARNDPALTRELAQARGDSEAGPTPAAPQTPSAPVSPAVASDAAPALAPAASEQIVASTSAPEMAAPASPIRPPPLPVRAPAAIRDEAVLKNIAAWEAALDRDPRNEAYRERYAAACAQSLAHLPTARKVYMELLQGNPTHTPWLRVLARIEGALGDSAGAYAFYAALLAVNPGDPEAQKFVRACRPLRPALPVRPFTNRDWDHIRSEFAPQAPYATSQGDIGAIAPRAMGAIEPQDTKVAPLTGLLSYLGISVPPLRLWPAGGRQCAVATGEDKALMVGAALYNDMPNRAGMFAGLRAILQAHDAEVHPAHGNNAAMLLVADVAEAMDALCAAQGMTLAPHGPREVFIKKTPELADLVRFALSPVYLQMRRELG